MTAGKDHYKQKIHDNTYATFYAATNTAMLEYPFIVGRYDECSPTLASQAEEYILDSAIGDEDIGNEEVIEKAADIGADAVVAADKLNDPEVTTERIVDMVEREPDFDVLIPLQFDDETDHEDHYDIVGDRLREIGHDITDYRIYVGGIMNKTAEEQIRRVINLREHVGQDTYLHGLGMGATREWVVTFRQCPWLLDSFDNSSKAKSYIKQSKILNIDMEWIKYPRPRGTNSTVVMTQFLEAMFTQFNYVIGSDIDERDALDEYEKASPELIERVNEHKDWYRAEDDSEIEVTA